MKIKDLETKEIRNWTVESMLDEINRDRNEDWVDYNELDFIDGWDEWVEGEFYTRHCEVKTYTQTECIEQAELSRKDGMVLAFTTAINVCDAIIHENNNNTSVVASSIFMRNTMQECINEVIKTI